MGKREKPPSIGTLQYPNRHEAICSTEDRGSGGTQNSASSGGHNDNSSSEARFSSTSTLPSSADVPLDDRPPLNATDPHSVSMPPLPGSNSLSFRAAGRAFSFGRKRTEPPSVRVAGPPPVIEHARSDGYGSFNRPRAMTESSYTSGSTATPPKLLGTGLELDQSDLSEFGSMFDSFGKSEIKLVEEPETLGITDTESLVCLEPLTSNDRPADCSIGETFTSTV